jgi:hypothetical protein
MKSFLSSLMLLVSSVAFAHEDIQFEYICSVYQFKSEPQEGRLPYEVVNVVFLPDWQKKSHLYHTAALEIYFEVEPVKNAMGEVERHEMAILFKDSEDRTTLRATGPEFSEIQLESLEKGYGARCFHRTMRGK